MLTLLIVLEARHTDQMLILEQVDGSHAGVAANDVDVAGRSLAQYTAVCFNTAWRRRASQLASVLRRQPAVVWMRMTARPRGVANPSPRMRFPSFSASGLGWITTSRGVCTALFSMCTLTAHWVPL
jgi:hypothetical protein